MPEFPEVKTLISTLTQTNIFNTKITEVHLLKPKLLKNSNSKDFEKFLLNEKIDCINQIGKYLVFVFKSKKVLLVHLRMEGKLIVDKINDKYILNQNHIMCYLVFQNKQRLTYFDSRMFGTFDIYSSYEQMLQSKQISKLGLDPFDKKLDAKYLGEKYKNKNVAIKTTLLDQTIILGIGNIYADEILFASKINPLTKAKNINNNELNLIIKNTRRILKLATKHCGTTIFSFKYDQNHEGSFQKYLKVHSRLNMPCTVCKTKIEKIKVNGRGTYYCPQCQKN